jgi:hypothetical protein
VPVLGALASPPLPIRLLRGVVRAGDGALTKSSPHCMERKMTCRRIATRTAPGVAPSIYALVRPSGVSCLPSACIVMLL